MAYYFISDLHLDKQRPATSQALLSFLDSIREDAEALYILGDFIEYWIGDDDTRHGLDEVFEALKTFAEKQCPIYLMHGNRDFLIGDAFTSQYRMQSIPDPYIAQIGNHSLLLTHGDMLCTDDKEYLLFRKQVRSIAWQEEFLAKPINERISIAENLRQQSQQAMQTKEMALMDTNEEAIVSLMSQHKKRVMIHGHTHKPAVHHHLVDELHCQRIVLSDWHKQPTFLKITGTQFELLTDAAIQTGELLA